LLHCPVKIDIDIDKEFAFARPPVLGAARVIESLVKLYDAVGKTNEAAAWRRNTDRLQKGRDPLKPSSKP